MFQLKQKQCYYKTNTIILNNHFEIELVGAIFRFSYCLNTKIYYACYVQKGENDFFIEAMPNEKEYDSHQTNMVLSALQYIIDAYYFNIKYPSIEEYLYECRKLSYYSERDYEDWEEEYNDYMSENEQARRLFTQENIDSFSSFNLLAK
jgi:hypothetical protein